MTFEEMILLGDRLRGIINKKESQLLSKIAETHPGDSVIVWGDENTVISSSKPPEAYSGVMWGNKVLKEGES